MRNYTTPSLCLLITLCLFQVWASPTISDEAKISKSTKEKPALVEPRLDDEDSELTPPPLRPVVAQILGTFLGANESQVNRTIERLTLSHNGIDPDISTTTEKETTKSDADEEEEEEEEESNDLNAEGFPALH